MAAEFIALKLAESIVSQAIERIADLLINEASSLTAVYGDIQSLQTELKWIESFLKDADKKQEKDERVRLWIAEVRDVACEIEDAIETYIYKVHSSYTKGVHLRKLRLQVNSIKDKLRNISDRRQRYQIEFPNGDREPTPMEKWRRSYPDEDDDDDVITLKAPMANLKDQLMRKEDRRCIVSIVGMGGLGKTTIAKKAYNDVDVKKNFSCYAWVFISQQYVTREILTEILMQVGFRSDKRRRSLQKVKYTKEFLEERRNKRGILKDLDDHELAALLKSELSEKRYLVVLDDIWSIDAWNSLMNAFPKGKLGSKVVFTTRIKEVALSSDPYSTPIELPLLTDEESWELLQRKAFPREIYGGHGCAPEFEELGKKMVKECGGLPLAIVVLGGLLRTKNSLDKWEKVQKDVKSRMINKLKSDKQYRVEDILDLSFQELPYYLKPCFLYLGSFPEDSEIPKRRLIRLWIAEGFIQARKKEEEEKGTLIEDFGEQYLEELIDRCMVQVDKNDRTGKGIKSCRLHDLMRDFCLSKAKEELFLEITQQQEINKLMASSSSVQYPCSRRVAIHVDNGLHQHTLGWAQKAHPHLRSLLCFSIHKFLGFPDLKRNFRLLRVLHLDFLDRTQLPYGIGNLIHLRYLRISGRGHNFYLPNSLGNLRNLQTLDLSGIVVYYGTELPSSVCKLKQLRHLLLPLSYSLPIWGVRSFFGGHNKRYLETLKGIQAKHLIKHNSVLPMPNIKVLGIRDLRSEKEVTLVLESLDSRSQLGHLRSLSMSLALQQVWLNFPKMELLFQCQVLSKLHLYGIVSDESLSFLPKGLSKLILWKSMLNQRKLTILEKLPNLRVLQLGYEDQNVNRTGKQWTFFSNGFPKLEALSLWHVGNVELWDVNQGALPSLIKLDIKGLSKLRMIPEGLKYVTTLRELNIIYMKKEFEDRLRRSNRDRTEGADFYKVRHIPSITFSDTCL